MATYNSVVNLCRCLRIRKCPSPFISMYHCTFISQSCRPFNLFLTTRRGMAGHSKWQNIKHTKEANDIMKSRNNSRFVQMIQIAVKDGGSLDPKLNNQLARVLEQARSQNIPTATLETALKNIQKSNDNAKLVLFEYKAALGGLFFLVEVLTGNINHTKKIMQYHVKKLRLVEAKGIARKKFDEKGILIASCNNTSLESATDHAIEVGAEDVEFNDGSFLFSCEPDNFLTVKSGLEKLGYNIVYASVDYIAINPTKVTEEDQDVIAEIISRLEENPEVVRVHVNL